MLRGFLTYLGIELQYIIMSRYVVPYTDDRLGELFATNRWSEQYIQRRVESDADPGLNLALCRGKCIFGGKKIQSSQLVIIAIEPPSRERRVTLS